MQREYIYTLGFPARQKESQFHPFPKQFVEQALRIPAPHSGKGARFTDLPEPTLIILPQYAVAYNREKR